MVNQAPPQFVSTGADMEFFYLDTDGTRAPEIVPGVLEQVAGVFRQLEADVYQMAFPTRFVGFDDELPPESPMGQCTRCQCPMDAELIDEHGICGECNVRRARDIMRIPPFARTDEDWEAVKELTGLGLVDVFDDGLE